MKTFGPYTLKKLLGKGANGEVYEALKAGAKNRVALKRLFPDVLEDNVAVARFMREFRTASRVKHPNVIRVFDAGKLEGTPYFTMELLSGETLRKLVTRDPQKRQPTRVLLNLLAQVAGALQALHGQGVVHRDVKPENVMLRGENDAVLSDFGVSRGTDDRQVTQPGQWVGSVRYLAPEVIQGSRADARSDAYAFGVMALELLTGRGAYVGSDPELLVAHVEAPVPDVTGRLPSAPEKLRDLLTQLLAKDPADRPSLARAASIMGHLAGEGVTLRKAVKSPARSVENVFVGREAELKRLEDLLPAVEKGGLRLAVVHGPAGLGKTRLCVELEKRAVRRGMAVATGRAGKGVSVPYQLWRAPLEHLARRLKLPVPDFDGKRGGKGNEHRTVVWREIRTLLHEAGSLSPVVLLLDDVDRADELSISLVARCAGKDVAAYRVLVVMTAEDPEPLLRLLPDQGRVANIGLGPLSADASSQLFRAVAPDDPAQPPPVTDGIPGNVVDAVIHASTNSGDDVDDEHAVELPPPWEPPSDETEVLPQAVKTPARPPPPPPAPPVAPRVPTRVPTPQHIPAVAKAPAVRAPTPLSTPVASPPRPKPPPPPPPPPTDVATDEEPTDEMSQGHVARVIEQVVKEPVVPPPLPSLSRMPVVPPPLPPPKPPPLPPRPKPMLRVGEADVLVPDAIIFALAVLGGRTPLPMVMRVLDVAEDSPPAALVTDALGRLLGNQVLVEDAGGSLDFVTESSRLQVYQAVPAAVRAHLHRRVAEAVGVLGDASPASAEVVAYHLLRAGLADVAVEHLASAAQAALAVWAPEKALTLVQRGLDALAGRPGLTGRELMEAAARAHPARAVHLNVIKLQVLQQKGQAEPYLEEARITRSVLAGSMYRALASDVEAHCAEAALMMARFHEADDHAHQALELARQAADPVREADRALLLYRVRARSGAGSLRQDLSEAIHLARRTGDNKRLVLPFIEAAALHLQEGQPALALRPARRALAVADAKTQRREKLTARRMEACAHLDVGDRARAGKLLLDHVADAELDGFLQECAEGLLDLARFHRNGMEFQFVETAVNRAMALARELGYRALLAPALVMRLEAACLQGVKERTLKRVLTQDLPELLADARDAITPDNDPYCGTSLSFHESLPDVLEGNTDELDALRVELLEIESRHPRRVFERRALTLTLAAVCQLVKRDDVAKELARGLAQDVDNCPAELRRLALGITQQG